MSTSADEKQVEPQESAEDKEAENLAEDDAELAFFNNKEPSRSDLPAADKESGGGD